MYQIIYKFSYTYLNNILKNLFYKTVASTNTHNSSIFPFHEKNKKNNRAIKKTVNGKLKQIVVGKINERTHVPRGGSRTDA